jgi:hypothetical protein
VSVADPMGILLHHEAVSSLPPTAQTPWTSHPSPLNIRPFFTNH